MNLIDVARSWYTYLHTTKEAQALAEKRLAVCDGCSYKQQLSLTSQMILNTMNHKSSIYKCELCDCPLASKAFSEKPCKFWVK